MNKFKLVCSDLDQTLINSGLGFSAGSRMIAEEFSFILKNEGIELDFDSILDNVIIKSRELDMNRLYNRDLWWNPILKQFDSNLELGMEEITRLTTHYWETVINGTVIYSDTFETLEYLKKKKYVLALITDTDGKKGMKDLRLSKSGVVKYFDHVIICGEHTKNPKPDPEPFLLAAKKAGVKASRENCCMLGDKPFTDIAGGQAAGFTTILIIRDNWEIDPKPDYIIKELHELKSIL